MNNFLSKVGWAIQHSLRAIIHFYPQIFWSQYARKVRQQGLSRLYLILSFDCDANEDIDAAEKIHSWLQTRGLKATYAVPGQQLERGVKIYRRLAEEGTQFINHGFLPHVEWRDGRYWSITFYREMSPQQVVDDIQCGHDTVIKVTGQTPKGFRAAHFGLFQKSNELKFLYKILRPLGYHYSTSTSPKFAMLHGPVWDVNGFAEIPLSGTYTSPFNVFDSWSNIISPNQPVVKDSYPDQFIQTIDQLLSKNIPGVLNYYVDPAHVCDRTGFFQALAYVVERGVLTLHYDELLKLIAKR